MTQPGETRHYSVADHVRAIYEHTKPGLFDFVVINRSPYRRPCGGGTRRKEPSRSILHFGNFLRWD